MAYSGVATTPVFPKKGGPQLLEQRSNSLLDKIDKKLKQEHLAYLLLMASPDIATPLLVKLRIFYSLNGL